MPRTLSVFVRTYAKENNAPRPSWYSKGLCLDSLLDAVRIAQREAFVEVTALHNGPVDDNPSWRDLLNDQVAPLGAVIEEPRRGNAGGFLSALRRAMELPDGRLVLLAEDDYLWRRESIAAMLQAFENIPADYLTAYDHPVRYQPDYPRGADIPHRYTTIHVAGGRHWRTQESTCMTFMATADTLRADRAYFEQYADNGKGVPDDRVLFRRLQGLLPGSTGRRLLFGPMPSLSTHAHLPWLAPLVDWDEIAAAVVQGVARKPTL